VFGWMLRRLLRPFGASGDTPTPAPAEATLVVPAFDRTLVVPALTASRTLVVPAINRTLVIIDPE